MVKRLYKGFSTRQYESQGGSLEIYDIDAVSEDLLNEIFTAVGDRVHMPTYGTRIPLLTFEINDAEVYDIIKEDLQRVVDHDPRVTANAIDVIPDPDKNQLIAIMKLNYIEFNVTRDLYITISSQ